MVHIDSETASSRRSQSPSVARVVDPLERVLRPIVEGQIRGFIKEHPSILKGVDWYKPRDDKAVTLTGSLAKRILRDLLCVGNRERIEAAFFTIWESEEPAVADLSAAGGVVAGPATGDDTSVERGSATCADCGPAGISTGWAEPILSAVREGRKPPVIVILE